MVGAFVLWSMDALTRSIHTPVEHVHRSVEPVDISVEPVHTSVVKLMLHCKM